MNGKLTPPVPLLPQPANQLDQVLAVRIDLDLVVDRSQHTGRVDHEGGALRPGGAFGEHGELLGGAAVGVGEELEVELLALDEARLVGDGVEADAVDRDFEFVQGSRCVPQRADFASSAGREGLGVEGQDGPAFVLAADGDELTGVVVEAEGRGGLADFGRTGSCGLEHERGCGEAEEDE